MSESKMREALELTSSALAKCLTGGSIKAHEAAHALQLADEALAQQPVLPEIGGSEGRQRYLAAQPAAGVELTDEGLDLLKMILPFIATQAIGCHGEKCREVWCHSCNGEFDAELAAEKGAALAFRLSKLIAAHEAKKNGGGV